MKVIQTINNHANDKASALVNELDKLSEQCEVFEKNEWSKANNDLIGMLEKIYSRYKEAAADSVVLDSTLSSLKAILAERGNRIQKNSTPISVFVRFVFNKSRQRVNAYSNALMAAHVAAIPPERFANFVKEAGGLEQCKVKFAPSPKTLEKQRQIAEAMPQVDVLLSSDGDQVLAEFNVDVQMLEAVKDRGIVFLIGTCDVNGNVKVRSVIPGYSERYEKWAKKKLAQYLNDHRSRSTTTVEQISMKKALAAIEKAGQEKASS